MRRQAIISAAEKVFFENGFENATMADIARESELSKGTLYLYFKNKSDLCHAIILRSLNLFKEMLLDQANISRRGMDKLKSFIKVFTKFTREYPNHYRSLLNFRYHLIDCHKEGDLYLESIRSNTNINEILIGIIREGIKDGSIRRDIDPVKISYSLWGNNTGILTGFILEQDTKLTQQEPDPAETIQYLFQLICNSLSPRGNE